MDLNLYGFHYKILFDLTNAVSNPSVFKTTDIKELKFNRTIGLSLELY